MTQGTVLQHGGPFARSEGRGRGLTLSMEVAVAIGLAWLGLSVLVAFFIYCCSVVSNRGSSRPNEGSMAVEGRCEPIRAVPAAPPGGRERRVGRLGLQLHRSKMPR